MKRLLALAFFGLFFAAVIRPVFGQSLGNAGTVAGTVVDASGGAIPKAAITIHNSLTNYTQAATSAEGGSSSDQHPAQPLSLGGYRPSFRDLRPGY